MTVKWIAGCILNWLESGIAILQNILLQSMGKQERRVLTDWTHQLMEDGS